MAARPVFDTGWQLVPLRHTRRWMRPLTFYAERVGAGVYAKWRGQWWLLGPRVSHRDRNDLAPTTATTATTSVLLVRPMLGVE